MVMQTDSTDSTCRLKITTTHYQTVFPFFLEGAYRSELCNDKYSEQIDRVKYSLDFKYPRPELGKVSVDIGASMIFWLVMLVLLPLLIGGVWRLFTKGNLWQIQIDVKYRTLTLNYLRLFSNYQITIPLDEIKTLIFNDNTHTEDAEEFYFLLHNYKK